MVAAKLSNLDKHSFRGNQSVTANLQEATTRKEAADLLNVSERTVNSAKKAEQHGSPELIEQVESGNVSVSAAADIAKMRDFICRFREVPNGVKLAVRVVSLEICKFAEFTQLIGFSKITYFVSYSLTRNSNLISNSLLTETSHVINRKKTCYR